ncbi:MAG TPA: hypothetical protein VG164_10365 [Trebonia sp.]|nr:hypothetical protein [Trebonia sp.]
MTAFQPGQAQQEQQQRDKHFAMSGRPVIGPWLHGGPALSPGVSLYSFFGYCLLVIAAILAVRVLVQVFRSDTG